VRQSEWDWPQPERSSAAIRTPVTSWRRSRTSVNVSLISILWSPSLTWDEFKRCCPTEET